MGRLPDTLRLVLTVSGRPVAGLLVTVGIAVTRRNGFRSIHGPSADDGVISLTRDDLLRAARRTLALGLMDYGDPEADSAGSLHVVPLDRQGVARALEGYERFKNSTQFGAVYRDNLVKADAVLLKLGEHPIDVQALSEGGDMRVVIGSSLP